MKFLIVDAFTETLFGGNPAGVVLLPDGEDFPSDERMVKTAAELRYSETAFVQRLGEKEFRVRYFTPAAEVDLCGHATIGTFCALAHLGAIKDGDDVLNHTLAGDLNITVDGDSVMMDMAPAKILRTLDQPEELQELYAVLGARRSEGKLFPQLSSTGLADIIVPVDSREDLNAMKPDWDALTELSRKYEVCGVHAFVMGGEEEITAYTRNFAPLYDINEEAATGTASGALTWYLHENGLIGDRSGCTFLQGEAMNRPSIITTELNAEGDVPRIRVGGSAVVLAEGEINL